MPTYIFGCQKCKKRFSLVATFKEYDEKKPAKFRCPKCGSREIKQLIESVNYVQKNKSPLCSCGKCSV